MTKLEEIRERFKRIVNHSGRQDSCDLCGAMLAIEDEEYLLSRCEKLEEALEFYANFEDPRNPWDRDPIRRPDRYYLNKRAREALEETCPKCGSWNEKLKICQCKEEK